MITHPRLAEYWAFIKKYSCRLVGIVIAFAISNILSIYKEEKFSEYEDAKNISVLVQKLTNDDNKLQFALRHRFNGENKNFGQFVSQIATKNSSQISSIEYVDESIIGLIKQKKVVIHGLFWHDIFIFAFLDALKNFSPGFLKILSVDINKFAKVSLLKPVLKVNVVCELFQKL
jgi:hypothetical protein